MFPSVHEHKNPIGSKAQDNKPSALLCWQCRAVIRSRVLVLSGRWGGRCPPALWLEGSRFDFFVVPVPETAAIAGEATGSLFKGSSCLTIPSR